ncbi:MAG: transglutaminase N-terminal domain-containing protein, partial [Pseudomonadota bacterium]
MELAIRHSTTYRFDAPVTYGLQQLRLTPKSRTGQSVLTWKMEVDGGRIESEFQDAHANTVTLLSFKPDANQVTVHCHGTFGPARVSSVDRLNSQSGTNPFCLPITPFVSSVSTVPCQHRDASILQAGRQPSHRSLPR